METEQSFIELNWFERLLFSKAREEKERNKLNLILSKGVIKHLEEENERLKQEIEKLKQQK